jgi:uncharacterized protein (TIGR00730 family)
MKVNRICVFCASSRQVDKVYLEAAHRLGAMLARESITVAYGGGAVGLMGELANGSLAEGGAVIGVIPEFMYELEWGHEGITELKIVKDMHERKKLVMQDSDAIIALPGGCGTFEELFEALTMKRLGFYLNPIVLVNVNGFYDPLIKQLRRCVDEKFMDERHLEMWAVVDRVDEVLNVIDKAPKWSIEARNFASI